MPSQVDRALANRLEDVGGDTPSDAGDDLIRQNPVLLRPMWEAGTSCHLFFYYSDQRIRAERRCIVFNLVTVSTINFKKGQSAP